MYIYIYIHIYTSVQHTCTFKMYPHYEYLLGDTHLSAESLSLLTPEEQALAKQLMKLDEILGIHIFIFIYIYIYTYIYLYVYIYICIYIGGMNQS
jgi:hypothetical protein